MQATSQSQGHQSTSVTSSRTKRQRTNVPHATPPTFSQHTSQQHQNIVPQHTAVPPLPSQLPLLQQLPSTITLAQSPLITSNISPNLPSIVQQHNIGQTNTTILPVDHIPEHTASTLNTPNKRNNNTLDSFLMEFDTLMHSEIQTFSSPASMTISPTLLSNSPHPTQPYQTIGSIPTVSNLPALTKPLRPILDHTANLIASESFIQPIQFGNISIPASVPQVPLTSFQEDAQTILDRVPRPVPQRASIPSLPGINMTPILLAPNIQTQPSNMSLSQHTSISPFLHTDANVQCLTHTHTQCTNKNTHLSTKPTSMTNASQSRIVPLTKEIPQDKEQDHDGDSTSHSQLITPVKKQNNAQDPVDEQQLDMDHGNDENDEDGEAENNEHNNSNANHIQSHKTQKQNKQNTDRDNNHDEDEDEDEEEDNDQVDDQDEDEDEDEDENPNDKQDPPPHQQNTHNKNIPKVGLCSNAALQTKQTTQNAANNIPPIYPSMPQPNDDAFDIDSINWLHKAQNSPFSTKIQPLHNHPPMAVMLGVDGNPPNEILLPSILLTGTMEQPLVVFKVTYDPGYYWRLTTEWKPRLWMEITSLSCAMAQKPNWFRICNNAARIVAYMTSPTTAHNVFDTAFGSTRKLTNTNCIGLRKEQNPQSPSDPQLPWDSFALSQTEWICANHLAARVIEITNDDLDPMVDHFSVYLTFNTVTRLITFHNQKTLFPYFWTSEANADGLSGLSKVDWLDNRYWEDSFIDTRPHHF
jgi:hypothetical protein